MTAEEILALPAGRKLDVLVAGKVMGMPWNGGNPIAGYDGRWPWPPPYSTDMEAAWEVALWLRNRWGQLELVAGLEWHCFPEDRHKGNCWGSGDTASLALCRAALLAVLL